MLFESQIKEFLHRTEYWKRKKAKNDLRNRLEEKRRILQPDQRDAESSAIVERLAALPAFQEAKVVLAYYPFRNEVNIRALLEEYKDAKVILLPVVKPHHRMELRQYTGRSCLHRGTFGIPEPEGKAYRGKIDLVIVPGVGFDEDLHRLGRGGGYYDRFLDKYPRVPKVAVAYDFQVVPAVPVDRHDKKVDLVVTPSRLLQGGVDVNA